MGIGASWTPFRVMDWTWLVDGGMPGVTNKRSWGAVAAAETDKSCSVVELLLDC